MVDRKREERKRISITGSSYYESPVVKQQEEFNRGGPLETPMLINSLLSTEVLITPQSGKDQNPKYHLKNYFI